MFTVTGYSSAGFPDEDGPDSMKRAAGEALLKFPNQYAPMVGLPDLRSAVARYAQVPPPHFPLRFPTPTPSSPGAAPQYARVTNHTRVHARTWQKWILPYWRHAYYCPFKIVKP